MATNQLRRPDPLRQLGELLTGAINRTECGSVSRYHEALTERLALDTV
jgi:hypothetical protein